MKADAIEFEAKVLEITKAINPSKAEFFNGTLFVECSIKEAIKLETLILDSMEGEVGVITSRVGFETAYDFV
jgi:fructose-specific phosphotransferase system component IIB